MPKRRKAQERERRNRMLGKRLAELRGARDFTQRELAEKLGVGQSLVSHFEAGRRSFDSLLVVELAQILGITTDELLGVKQIKKDGQQLPRQLVRRLRSMDELSRRDQMALLRTIDAFLDRAQLRKAAPGGSPGATARLSS